MAIRKQNWIDMLRCTIVEVANIEPGNTVSLTAHLFHSAASLMTAVPVADVARGVFDVAALGGLAVFFRPLLMGIGRALVLTVRPRRARIQPQDAISG
jgi:hypothetical protein